MRWLVAVFLIAVTSSVHAEPWLCAEPDGTKRFSYEPESAKRKECVHHPIPSPNVWRSRPRADQDAAGFPRVDARTQKERDLARREILARELAEEKRALAEAMRQLEEQKQRHARDKDRARVDAGLKPYHDRVRVHLTNISNLEKELGG
jgi:hypothetical protein